jgi:glycerophosphoryl diester phosphodiesterase
MVTQKEQSMTTYPIIVAHRGLAGYAPENTLAAYTAALALGFGIEVDLTPTRDGEIVMLHDRQLERTTSGQGAASEHTLEAIRRLDAGSWFHPVYADQQVPTLDEMLALAGELATSSTLVALDLKAVPPELLAHIVDAVRSRGLVERVMAIGITISSAEVRRQLKELARELPTARLVETEAQWDETMADPLSDWIYIRHVPSAERVAAAHAMGKRIFKAGPLANGIEPEAWRALAAAGVDAVLSDYPLECRQTLG